MHEHTTKAAIIGLGNVGSALAYDLIGSALNLELGLYDIDQDLAKSQYFDLLHALPIKSSDITLKHHTNLSTVQDCKVICITAGISQKPGQNRLALLNQNYGIIRDIINQVITTNSEAIIIILTNPVDVILSKLFSDPSNQGYAREFGRIISTGTLLDTHRLYAELGLKPFNYDYTTEPMIVGEHGDSQKLLNPTIRRISNETQKAVREFAYDIIQGKGYTNFGIAATTSFLIDILIQNKSAILPLSTHYSYASKHFGVALSVPVAVGGGKILGIMNGYDTAMAADIVRDSKSVILSKSSFDGI